MFLNKLDRAGASFRSSVLSLLAHRLHPKPMVLVLPIASFDPSDYSHAEPGVQGLVDLVNWEVWRWTGEGDASRHPLPTDLKAIEKMGLFPREPSASSSLANCAHEPPRQPLDVL